MLSSVQKSFFSAFSSSSERDGMQQPAEDARHSSRGWDAAQLSFVTASGELDSRFSSGTTSGSFSSAATNSYAGIRSVGLERLVYRTSTGKVAFESDEDRTNRLLTARFAPLAQTGWRPEGSAPSRRVRAERRLNERRTAMGKTPDFFVREAPLTDGSRRSALCRRWEKLLAAAEPGHARFRLLSRRWDRRWNNILQAVEEDKQQEGVLYFHQKLGRPLVHKDADAEMFSRSSL